MKFCPRGTHWCFSAFLYTFTITSHDISHCLTRTRSLATLGESKDSRYSRAQGPSPLARKCVLNEIEETLNVVEKGLAS